jgi:hypothetical protein
MSPKKAALNQLSATNIGIIKKTEFMLTLLPVSSFFLPMINMILAPAVLALPVRLQKVW